MGGEGEGLRDGQEGEAGIVLRYVGRELPIGGGGDGVGVEVEGAGGGIGSGGEDVQEGGFSSTAGAHNG